MGEAKPEDPPSPTSNVWGVTQADASLTARKTALLGEASPPLSPQALPLPLAADDRPTTWSGPKPPRIGRYILLRALGAGGMGVVYAAYDEELDRKVAVKLLHPSGQGDEQLRSRVLREAQALARVSSPSVVHVYQVGETGGQIFIAMEFVNGTTLSKWQAEPGRSWQELLRMYATAGQGLLAAHQAGLVHRDFKPDNVLLGKDGWPRVADFGIARVQSSHSGVPSDHSAITKLKVEEPASPAIPNLTQTGVALGTPLYMSPEQHQGQPVDHRSDQFSFCVALYEALYGQMPFAGATLAGLRFNVISGKILPRPADSHVPTVVHEAILRGLAVQPEDRFPSMSELLAALSIDIATDAAIGPGARREVIIGMLAVSLTAALGIKLPEWAGLPPQQASLTTAGVLFAFFSVMTLRFRKVIRKNWFHRGMLMYGFVVAAWMLALRIVGSQIGLGLPQIMTLDLLFIAAASTTAVATLLAKLWPMIPASGAGVIIATIEPRAALYVAPLVLLLGYVMTAYRWYQAALKSRPKKRPSVPSLDSSHSPPRG